VTVTIACKYNQARSIIGAAVIRKWYPDLEVISTGINATLGGLIPLQIRQIADQWALPITETFSTPIGEVIEQVAQSELIIGADEEVTTRLIELFPNIHPVNLQDQAQDFDFVPKDPSGMDPRSTETELAKVVMLTTQKIFSHFQAPTNFPITAFIPRTPDTEEEISQVAINKAKSGNAVIIDMNFRAPNITFWQSQDLPVHSIDTEFINQALEIWISDYRSPSIICPTFELLKPEAMWTDVLLQKAIRKLANNGPVLLISAPLRVNNRPAVDAS
jgi:protein-tyrosine-phosphatase